LVDDSDNDSLLDGEEDIKHNGRIDPGETDPGYAKTKGAMPGVLLSLLLDD
jgi:hypothetical protein